MENLITKLNKNGCILISVPIEIGSVGIIKYLLKRFIYRYDLPLNVSDRSYLISLLNRTDISRYREPSDGYGSHFGFDYRCIDQYLKRQDRLLNVESFNAFTTRFYMITHK